MEEKSRTIEKEKCMFAAARQGNRQRLRTLLLHHCVEDTDDRGNTPLHVAAEAGRMGCVREILCMVASSGVFTKYVNTTAANGQTAVFMAAANGHVDVVSLLVTAGADINIKDASGRTPLLAAVSNDNLAMAKVLIRRRANVRQTDASKQSCLHLASAQGSSELVSFLLPFCSLELGNKKQKTALYLAAENGHKECLEILANAGANVNVQARDSTTPLMAAIKAQSEQCMEVLLKHGADPNVVCSILWPQLPIHVAVKLENVNILKRLVAVTTREVDSKAGMVSPVYEALERPEMLKVLLSEGFSPEAQPCMDVYEVGSPLALVLSVMVDEFSDYGDSMHILRKAGARMTEECWETCLGDPMVLDLLLEQTCADKGKGPGTTRLLAAVEVEALQNVAADQAAVAGSWLPALLECGLDPNDLLVPDFLEEAQSDTLTYLLEMVNWSTLTRPLRDILEQRKKMKTWTPCAHLESIPPLFHLCRLRLRSHLGPDLVMRTDVVRQLPVPPLLHDYLVFADIPAPTDS